MADQMTTTVTADEVLAVARQYDHEVRGGCGRGDIDEELAERLAVWFNARASQPAEDGVEDTYPGGTAAQEIERITHIARAYRTERDRFRGALQEVAAPGCASKCPPIRLPDDEGYDADTAAPCAPCFARWVLDHPSRARLSAPGSEGTDQHPTTNNEATNNA